jgi:tRNA (mo5U34)-methyltransferase
MTSSERTGVSSVSEEELRQRAEKITWYHTFELAPGLVTPGMFDHRPYLDHYGLPADLSGKRALDVGAMDGFFAFELERRGAEVVALDLNDPSALDWPRHLRDTGVSREAGGFPLADDSAFSIVSDTVGSSVERVPLNIYDVTQEQLGKFDLVFAGSMHVHLRDPVRALERMADVCSGQLVFADAVSRRLDWVPRLKLAEFTGESPWMTWWIPTTRTMVAMTRCAGFTDVTVKSKFDLKFAQQSGGVYHAVVHANGPA